MLNPFPVGAGTARAGAGRPPGSCDRGRCSKARVSPHSRRGHRPEIDRRRGVIEQLLGTVHADALAHSGECLQNARESLRDRWRRPGNASQRQHCLIQFLDVLDQVLALEGQPFHLLPDRVVGRLEVFEFSTLL